MKIEYKRHKEIVEPVACMLGDDIIFRTDGTGNVGVNSSGIAYSGLMSFDYICSNSKKKFYPGDKITITF